MKKQVAVMCLSTALVAGCELNSASLVGSPVPTDESGETGDSGETDQTVDSSETDQTEGSDDSAEIGVTAVSGQAWVDTNADGERQTGENPLGGLRVTLYTDHNEDGVSARVIASRTTDSTGQYTFADLEPGNYSVGVDPLSFPTGFYRLSPLANGAGSIVSPDSLRSSDFELASGSVFTADVGILPGSDELTYHGLHPWGAVMAQRWSYQDLIFTIDDDGLPITEQTKQTIKQWIQWYAKADKISQYLVRSEDWYLLTRLSNLGNGPLDNGKRSLLSSTQSGSQGTGLTTSSGINPTVLRDNPDNISVHRLMFYEMNRGTQSNGSWHSRGIWPPNATVLVAGAPVIMTPHLFNAVILWTLGNPDDFNDRTEQSSWIAADIIEPALDWSRFDVEFLDAYPGWEELQTIPLYDPHTGLNEQHYFPFVGILFKISVEEGLDTLAEILMNIGENPIPGSQLQAAIQFTRAINDATDGRYQDALVNDWGLPPDTRYLSTRGINTGTFADNIAESYKWDFAPHSVDDSVLLPDHALFSERSTEGFFRFVELPEDGSAPFYLDKQAQTTPGDHTFIKTPWRTKFAHEIQNGTWVVTLNVQGFYDRPVFAEGEQVTLIQKPAVQAGGGVMQFEVEVVDGVLDFQFVSDYRIYSMTIDPKP